MYFFFKLNFSVFFFVALFVIMILEMECALFLIFTEEKTKKQKKSLENVISSWMTAWMNVLILINENIFSVFENM